MGGARRHAHRAVVTAFITIHAANAGIAWPCQLRNRYEFVTKVSRSGSSEEMGCEHRVRIAHVDRTLFFLWDGALVVGSRRHSLEGAGTERRYLYRPKCGGSQGHTIYKRQTQDIQANAAC